MKKEAMTMTPSELIAELESEFTGIIGFTELMATQEGDGTFDDRAVEVLAAAERALVLSRMLGSRLRESLAFRECDLNELIRSTLPELRRIAGRNVEILIRLNESLPRAALAPDEVAALLRLIVAESTHAMEAEGRITIRTYPSARALGDQTVRLAVEDSASVIDDADGRRMLGAPEGTIRGLDWEEQARMLEAAGATARFRTDPGIGSTLTVTLPAHSGRFEAR